MSRARELADSYTDNEVDSKPSGFKNYIINGDFDIWQRGTQFEFTAETHRYHADRWLTAQFGSGGTQTISQITSLVDGGNDYVLRCFQTTACNNKTVQILDNYSSKSLRGRKMTVSFWYRAKGGISSLIIQRTDTQTYSSEFASNTPEGSGTIIGASSGLTSDETWRYASYTTVTTHQNGYFHLVFSQPVAINDYYEIARVQVEEGSVATPFEQRPYGLELSLCQRYYEVVTGYIRNDYRSDAVATFGSAISYKQSKRGVPILTKITESYSGATAGLIDVIGSSLEAAVVTATGSVTIGGQITQSYHVLFSASAEL